MKLKKLGKLIPGLARLRRSYIHARVSALLGTKEPPNTEASERAFEKLQTEFPSNRGDSYRYDDVSLFARASHRANQILKLEGLAVPAQRILELGAGDGVLGALLHTYGHECALTDMEDWRSRICRSVPFTVAEISKGLLYDDAIFDLVISYNSFEHFPDPCSAFREAVRVTKPGGRLFFEFGPLYNSPWGLHAYRSLFMPYPQFLFGESFIKEKLNVLGVHDLGKSRHALQYVNKWSWADFEKLWRDSSVKIRNLDYVIDDSHLEMVIRFPKAFSGRGLSVDDLVKNSISVELSRC